MMQPPDLNEPTASNPAEPPQPDPASRDIKQEGRKMSGDLPPLRKPPAGAGLPRERKAAQQAVAQAGEKPAGEILPKRGSKVAKPPKPPKTKKNTQPKPPRRGLFFQLGVVVSVAILVATLFSAWTPGQAWPTPPPLEAATSIAQQQPPTLTPLGAPTATPRTKPLIGIVAGHWKHDSGAVCLEGQGDELREVDINLNIATLVQKALVAKGYDVELLGEFDPQLTGYQATALVSIHNDSCEFINAEATGFKVASAWATRHPEYAARLTACLRSRYGQITGLPLHSTSVTVDMSSYHAFDEIDENTPAAIIETGFMNLDKIFLTEHPDVAAEGIVAGIECYLRNESIAPTNGSATPSIPPVTLPPAPTP